MFTAYDLPIEKLSNATIELGELRMFSVLVDAASAAEKVALPLNVTLPLRTFVPNGSVIAAGGAASVDWKVNEKQEATATEIALTLCG